MTETSILKTIEEEISKETSFYIPGLVNQLNYNNYLLPLFEAVVNAIQSIDISKNKKGHIEIYINRISGQKKLLNEESTYKVQYIKDIIISDNGEGFNNKNLKSFLSAYSTEKQKYGCKGVGRFTWLKAFREVRIESLFKDDSTSLCRKFTYRLPDGIQKDYSEEIFHKKTSNKTTIKLIDMQDRYFYKSNQKIITIAKKILEHCFYYFASKKVPTIIVSGYDNEDLDKQAQSFCLNEMFKDLYSEHIECKTLTIKGNRLEELNKKIGEVNQADLAEYVTYRKIVLTLFEQYLKYDATLNKYYEEKVIHDLIYPMQSTSDEVTQENHNLWLIDDRLSFSQFIASDKSLKSIGLNSKSSKEPDLLFFDSIRFVRVLKAPSSPFNALLSNFFIKDFILTT